MAYSQTSQTISHRLLNALRTRDAEGWGRFVALYGPYIYARSRREGVNQADAADITQQVLMKVLNGVGDFRRNGPDDSFRGWLTRICQNAIIDHVRARQGRPAAEGGTEAWQKLQQHPTEGDTSNVAPADPDQGELARRAWQLIASEFSENARKAFELVVLQGRTAAESAALLGLTPSGVRMSKSRILRRLREELGEID